MIGPFRPIQLLMPFVIELDPSCMPFLVTYATCSHRMTFLYNVSYQHLDHLFIFK
jgi:hypothetical protein